jgi:TonB family protein
MGYSRQQSWNSALIGRKVQSMNRLIAVAVVALIPCPVQCQADAGQQTPPPLRVDLYQVFVKKSVQPVYPEEAQKKFIQGPVLLDVVIGNDGKVESVHTIRGDSVLAKAAAEAVQQWTFYPFRKDGKPLRVIVMMTQSFYLAHGDPTAYIIKTVGDIPLLPENTQSPAP